MSMTRTNAREIAVQLGFSVLAPDVTAQQLVEDFFEPEHYASLAEESELYKDKPGKQLEFILASVQGVMDYRLQLDEYITKYAKDWRVERIDRTAQAILRQAMFEILYLPDIGTATSINEAVEMAKGYEDPEVVAFINGVLGGFVRGEGIAENPASSAESETAEAPEA